MSMIIVEISGAAIAAMLLQMPTLERKRERDWGEDTI